ncbi:hypothetical protein HYT45_03175 [Candidatus Uhrbacteria bacterium]|nr:hypothetical protein [Candidatus Uhrbacteria bacterium]
MELATAVVGETVFVPEPSAALRPGAANKKKITRPKPPFPKIFYKIFFAS